MFDREKVIKALEACTTKQTKCFANDDKLCPYFSVDILYCERELMRDALALLKEQVPLIPIIASSEDCPWVNYYVCPKCKISIDYHDKYCRYCGGEMRWEEETQND